MIIYADLYLVMSWIADFLLLKMLTQGQSYSVKRIALAAACGSLSGLGLTVLPLVMRIPGSLLVAVLMLKILYFRKAHTSMHKQLLLLYGYGFFVSGFVQTLYRWVLFSSRNAVRGTIYAIILWILMILVCQKIWNRFIHRYGTLEKRRQLIDLEISFHGRTVFITGLVDTGNELIEPRTGFPIIVAEPSEAWNLQALSEEGSQLFPILYRTASSKNACMMGFQPDYIRWNDRCTNKIIVAVSRMNPLDPKGRYHALVSPQMMNNES